MEQSKKTFLDRLPKSLIRRDEVSIFPEGALGYLIGPTLAMLPNSVLANYFNAYMSNVLNINRWAAWFFQWIPLISVVVVIFGNILVGQLMDGLKTKAGKARPLLICSLPLNVAALLILFVFSPYVNETMPEKQTIALVLLAVGYLLLFGIAYPLYSTPHAALVNLSTRNSKDRSLLATISNATALAAMGATSMILPFFLRLLFVYQTTDLPADAVPVYASNGSIDYYTDASGAALYDGLASYQHWKVFVLILLAVTAVGVLVEFLFTRERVTEEGFTGETEKPREALPKKAQAGICFRDRFWYIMMGFIFFYQLGGMLKNVSQLYFCQAMFPDAAGNYTVAYGGQLQGTLAIVGAVPTAIGMVVAWPLSNKIGKARAILLGALLAVAGGVLGLLFPTNFPVVVVSFVVKALGSTPAMYLSLALLADTLDHQEALSGNRTDGFSMAIYGAIMSGMTGIATGIMNGILSALNYSSSNISSPAIRAAMPWIFIGGETFGYLAIFVMMLFMKVEKYGELDHFTIRRDQGQKEELQEKDASLIEEYNRLLQERGRAPLT